MPDGPLRRYSFANGSSAEVFADRVVTRFGDGAFTEAKLLAPDDPGFLQLTRDLGYGDDAFWNMAEHETLHSLLAEWAEEEHSGILWGQAHDPARWHRKPGPRGEAEERRVWTMQRLLNWVMPEPKDAALLKAALKDPNKAVRDARNLLRPDGVAMTSAWAKR